MNSIKEVIVVEGRDDTAAVKRALCADTIETHGFGIKKETWQLLQKAYNERGIIIFTDPDFSGEEIRKKLSERFPKAKHAYLTRQEARKGNDIGIENAEPDAIREALSKARVTHVEKREEFTMQDLLAAGLCGSADSKEKRDRVGRRLGIGYGSSKRFLEKLNQYGISREDFLNSI